MRRFLRPALMRQTTFNKKTLEKKRNFCHSQQPNSFRNSLGIKKEVSIDFHWLDQYSRPKEAKNFNKKMPLFECRMPFMLKRDAHTGKIFNKSVAHFLDTIFSEHLIFKSRPPIQVSNGKKYHFTQFCCIFIAFSVHLFSFSLAISYSKSRPPIQVSKSDNFAQCGECHVGISICWGAIANDLRGWTSKLLNVVCQTFYLVCKVCIIHKWAMFGTKWWKFSVKVDKRDPVLSALGTLNSAIRNKRLNNFLPAKKFPLVWKEIKASRMFQCEK